MDLAREEVATAVFSTLPLKRHGFAFAAKRDFRDLLRMRYGLPIPNLPQRLDHSQVCSTGGFIHMRHDEPKNLWASESKKVFRDVEVEPKLQPLSGERMRHKTANVSDDARSDVRVGGFWGNSQSAFFEFRVFYPHAQSYADKKLDAVYHSIVQSRKRQYEERINVVDSGCFTPMVMASTGGMAAEMSKALKHLAQEQSSKLGEAYSVSISVLRCKFAFCMARCALRCLRGSRAVRSGPSSDDGSVLIAAEARINRRW